MMRNRLKVGIFDSKTLRRDLIEKIIRENFGKRIIIVSVAELSNSKGELLGTKGFDLIFIHEHNSGFLEFLVRCISIPTIVHTGAGVTNSAKYSHIHKYSYLAEAKSYDDYKTFEKFYIKDFIEDWLSRLESNEGSKPEFEILSYGKTSRVYEHIYDILSAFLPLDVELQLENNSDRYISEARNLIEQEDEIKMKCNNLKLEANWSGWEALEALLREVRKMKDVKTQDKDRKQIFKNFHKIYKQLRDDLFKHCS